MANARSTSSFFYFAWKVPNWELSKLRLSVLKLSNMFPISVLVTPPPDGFVTLEARSWGPFLDLVIPREYRLHSDFSLS
jgi:hypothetical protein